MPVNIKNRIQNVKPNTPKRIGRLMEPPILSEETFFDILRPDMKVPFFPQDLILDTHHNTPEVEIVLKICYIRL